MPDGYKELKKHRYSWDNTSLIPSNVIDTYKSLDKDEALAYACCLRFIGQWGYDQLAIMTGKTAAATSAYISRCMKKKHIGHRLLIDNNKQFIYPLAIPSIAVETTVWATFKRLPDAVVEELWKLKEGCKGITNFTPVDDEKRKIAEKYAAELAKYVAEGYSISGIASSLGVSTAAINGRLVRYGYKTSNGTSTLFQPIKYRTTYDQGEVL